MIALVLWNLLFTGDEHECILANSAEISPCNTTKLENNAEQYVVIPSIMTPI